MDRLSDEASTRRELTGRVAVVTGASRGIGAAVARELAARGAAVIVNYLSNRQAADGVVESIQQAGGEALAIAADVRDEQAIDGLVAATLDRFGRIDIAVVNAAMRNPPAPFAELECEQLVSKVTDELRGAFILSKAVLPEMRRHGYGRLIYVSSEMALTVHTPGMLAHATAKAALEAFVRNMAVELREPNITANVVSPGLVLTEASAHIPAPIVEYQARTNAAGRIATPEDVAPVIAFYAGQDSAFITGTRTSVDAGYRQSSTLGGVELAFASAVAPRD